MFMHIAYAKSFEEACVQLQQGTYLLLVAEKTPLSLEHVPSHANICGAIFPRLIYGEKSFDEGVLYAKLHESTTFSIAPLMHTLDGIHSHEHTHNATRLQQLRARISIRFRV